MPLEKTTKHDKGPKADGSLLSAEWLDQAPHTESQRREGLRGLSFAEQEGRLRPPTTQKSVENDRQMHGRVGGPGTGVAGLHREIAKLRIGMIKRGGLQSEALEVLGKLVPKAERYQQSYYASIRAKDGKLREWDAKLNAVIDVFNELKAETEAYKNNKFARHGRPSEDSSSKASPPGGKTDDATYQAQKEQFQKALSTAKSDAAAV
jgi:hypothetical protein